VLVDIARSQPKSRGQLGQMRSVRGPLIDRHGDRLLELVAESRQTKPPLPAKRGRQVTLDAAGEALADALSAVIRLRAKEVDLNPASLASRKDLARIASGEAAHEVLAGWRAGLVADQLDALASGRSALRVKRGNLAVLDD
jgi:ribonuclease D